MKIKTSSLNGVFLTLIALVVLAWSQTVQAACSDPEGNEADITYNQTYNVPMVCDGSNWQALGPSNASAGTGGCSVPDGDEGDMTYNTSHDVMQYCDGENWISIQGASYEGTSCFLPPDECPAASGSNAGCISSRTLSWGTTSCSTTGGRYQIVFNNPLVDGDVPAGADSSSASASAQYWCADLGFNYEASTSANGTADNYWARITSDDTGWLFRPNQADRLISSITCFIHENGR